MKILTFTEADQKIKNQIFDFVLDIRLNEMGWKTPPDDLLDIPNVYLTNKGNFWIVVDNDKLIGTAGVKDMKNNQAYLERMYVDNNFRGTGLAKELLEVLLDYARRNEFKEIYLQTADTAKRAIAFYIKNGFEQAEVLPASFHHYNDAVFYHLQI